jgi:hypothetical protein
MPKSCAATKQARSKSCEISSLMTAIRKGELAKAAQAGMGRAVQKAAAAPAPARKLRLEKVITVFLSSALDAYGLS